MERNSFLRIFTGTLSALVLPFRGLTGQERPKRVSQGFMVPANKDRNGKSISPFDGDTFYCKVASKDTAGDIYVFESTREKGGGPPLHYHPDQDEWWYVLSGEFNIKVGDQVYHAKAGDSVFGPRMVPHTFSKTGEGEAKLLMFFQPAGKMEAFFNAVSEGATKNMAQDQLNEYRKQHGFVVTGPPLDFLKQ